jgi:periplasmic divalent cation tolerance protein
MPVPHIALSTAPNEQIARDLVRTLVDERIVACGNIVTGVQSIYRWHEAVEEEAEVIIVFKTTAAAWPRLQQRLPELHPYETPELLLLPVTDGLGAYLKWMNDSTELADE